MFPHSQKYLNPQIRNKKLVNSVLLPPLSFKINLRDTSFHISLNSLGLLNFLWLGYFNTNICVKKFSIYGVQIPKKSLNLCFFTHAPVAHSKPLLELFVSPKTETRGGRKKWFALSKFNQKIWRRLGTLVYFHLIWLQIF